MVDLQARCVNAIRFLAADAVQRANSGHPGLPLGAAAAAHALWSRHLRFDAADPQWCDRDRFVLSAGHGSMLLYALLHLAGCGLTLDDLRRFRQLGSRTPGHPEARHTPGVEATTGPLGQGFANAVGMAIAEAHLAATYNREEAIVDHFTYVLAGDGDLMEGVSAEAASLAGHLALGKLIVLYDDNAVSLAGPTSVAFTEDVAARFAAYGWQTIAVGPDDANDVDTLDRAIASAKAETRRPTLISIRTTIGFGSPEAGTFKTHGEPLGEAKLAQTRAALGWEYPPFTVPHDVYAFWRKRATANAGMRRAWNERYARWRASHPALAAQFERARAGTLPDALPWPNFTAENGDGATREAGGAVMNAIAPAFPELIGGSADLDPSTKTYLNGQGEFAPGSYAGRNVHFGVREHAMAAAMNGIALHGGLLPFGATFFTFSDYLKPALRLAALNRLRGVFVFTHDSVFVGEDGPTHQPIEQLAMLRAMPGLTVVRPADALETLEAWKLAIQPRSGPWALVLSRQKTPFLGERSAQVARGAYIVHEPRGALDLVLIATGTEVALAIAAAKLLDARDVKARVVSMPSWELFDAQDATYRSAVLPAGVRARISIEAGATIGWQRYLGDGGIAIGIDGFGASAPGSDLAAHFGFTPERIVEVAQRLLGSQRAAGTRPQISPLFSARTMLRARREPEPEPA
ncbi:transketolase [Vulcanimicrobium alpinum]|uniref:Transketolase n=1 Tax=Vulcanimicrobium alpinum TaxID=3016050 RepID=A0AAN1XZ72_UNVUL|nr:transketolase [Vulcanimicrobium alpinum]BDE08102.1 transketolase [Vulcanimicrobium alpinum]